MHVKEMIYLNREAQLGLWEFIHAHDSMIDEVRGNNYYSEPIAFELDDSDIKETIRPYTMGRIIDIRQFFAKYACDPDEPSVCIRFYIEDDLLAWNNGYFTYLFDSGKCIETEQHPKVKDKRPCKRRFCLPAFGVFFYHPTIYVVHKGGNYEDTNPDRLAPCVKDK
jgi:predicted acetyltransferase